MKNFIVWVSIALIFVVSIVYFVFSSDKSLTITYIKFNINPEFIIGVNNEDEVKIYNPLNDDAKVLNLTMFNGYKLNDAMKIIFNKLEEKEYFDISQIDMTVITKSDSKINYYYNMINSVINERDKNIVLVNNDATYDELLAYSNEITYDLKQTYFNDTLVNIAVNLEDDIKIYMDNKIKNLNLEKLSFEEQKNLILIKQSEQYFDDYEINNYIVKNYPLELLKNSSYQIDFTYENEINYKINLHLSLQTNKEVSENNIVYQVFEEYNFIYQNNAIQNLKVNFYKVVK